MSADYITGIVCQLKENDMMALQKATESLKSINMWPLQMNQVADIVEMLPSHTSNREKVRALLGVLCNMTWDHGECKDLSKCVVRVLEGISRVERLLGIQHQFLIIQEIAMKGIRQCTKIALELVPKRAVSDEDLRDLVQEKNELLKSLQLYCFPLYENLRPQMRSVMAPLAAIKLTNFAEEMHLRIVNGKIRIATMEKLASFL